MIVIDRVCKRFGEVVATNAVSFKAEDGRITGLLGPNGAGKTTTLRMLVGLLRPDSGTVHVDNIDVAADPNGARGRIGLLPDARGLYDRLTAREHALYYAALHGIGRRQASRRLAELSKLLDMEALLDRRVAGFSNGERTKVALARALVHDPHNVVLDEPTNGLDVMSTRAVRSLVRALRAQGRCVLFSSHVMAEVAAVCDHIVVVADGRVVAVGTPEGLMSETGQSTLEDAFVSAIGSEEGLLH